MHLEQPRSPSPYGGQQPSTPPQLDPNDIRLIQRKARQLCRQRGFTKEDRLDIEQDLVAQLIARLDAYDPAELPRDHFVTMVICRAAIDLIRHRRAEKRRAKTESLSGEVMADERLVELAQLIGPDEQNARHGRQVRSEQEQHELLLDIETLANRVPPPLCELLECLKQDTMAEAARKLKKARTTLYTSVAQLRAACEKIGLQDYLPGSSTPRDSTA